MNLRPDFLVESIGLPRSIKHQMKPDDNIGDEISRDPPPKIVGQVQVGVLSSLDNAEAMADFIKNRIAEFRKLRQKAK